MSYLLDTNVVSEVRRPRGDPKVKRWVENAPDNSLYLSVLTVGELRAGVERLRNTDVVQATALESWLSGLVAAYAKRILWLDLRVAQEWGRLQAAAGPLPPVDGMLAATAKMNGLQVATRNVAHFERTGVSVVNPWLDPPVG